MAFVLPGVGGTPITARNYTAKMRKMPGLIGWYTMVQRAQLLDPPLFVPRAGVGLLNPVGTPRYQLEQGEMVSYYPPDLSDRWESPFVQVPSENVMSVVCAFNSAEGYSEPIGLQFDNGARLWAKPTHGGASGLEYLPHDGSGNVQIPIAGVATTNNAPHFIIFAFNYSTGVISYQVDGGAISQVTQTAINAGMSAAITVGLRIGMGRTSQNFVGRIMEAAWFRGNVLTQTGTDTLAIISEYMPYTWGI